MCAGPRILRPPIVSSTMWAFSRPRSKSARSLRATWTSEAGESIFNSFARRGLMRIALSQLIFVIGSGHSCSQPLLANRPSSTVASATKRTSSAPAETGGGPPPARYLVTPARLKRTGNGLSADPSSCPPAWVYQTWFPPFSFQDFQFLFYPDRYPFRYNQLLHRGLY